MIAGIILAAGASTRMGSPKALLDYLATPAAKADEDRPAEAADEAATCAS